MVSQDGTHRALYVHPTNHNRLRRVNKQSAFEIPLVVIVVFSPGISAQFCRVVLCIVLKTKVIN